MAIAPVKKQLAVVFVDQADEGTISPDIGGLGGTVTEADGLVWGNPDSGTYNSGIDYSIGRHNVEQGMPMGGFTERPGQLIRNTLASFTFSWLYGGPQVDPTPGTDADFAFPHSGKGIETLLKMAGLFGATATAEGLGYTGYAYRADYSPLGLGSARIYDSGTRIDLRDLRVTSLTIEVPVGGFPTATATLVGNVDAMDAIAFPTLTEGPQYDECVLKGQGMTLTYLNQISFVESFTMELDNGVEEIMLSEGIKWRQTSRTVSANFRWLADAAAPKQHIDRLEDADPMNTATLRVGDPWVSGVAKAWEMQLTNFDTMTSETDVEITMAANVVDGTATREGNEANLLLANL